MALPNGCQSALYTAFFVEWDMPMSGFVQADTIRASRNDASSARTGIRHMFGVCCQILLKNT